jgi:prepilin peptidase CpaA
MSNLPFITVGAVLFVIAVAIVDMRSHKIPNVLTVSMAMIGLTANGVIGGPEGVLEAGAGLLVGLGVFLPFFLMGGFGGGDVKAMAATGAFLGTKGVLMAAAFTLVAGAVAGVILLMMSGGGAALRALAQRWMMRLFVMCATRSAPDITAPANDPAARRFPYGAAIACGTLISLAWKGIA